MAEYALELTVESECEAGSFTRPFTTQRCADFRAPPSS